MHTLRAALFVDFENLYRALRRRHLPGATPHIDFERLVDYVRQTYGGLEADDFILVADLRQRQGVLVHVSRLARLVDIRTQKADTQAVARNASNVVMAYYLGLHAGRRPADLYVIVTGDSALAAAGDMLQRAGRQVTFIIPGDTPSPTLGERFHCVPFSVVHPIVLDESVPQEPAGEQIGVQVSPSDEIVRALSTLHREFPGSGIPTGLLRAMLGPGQAQRGLNRARSEGVIDLWKDKGGVECASLSQMRIGGKPVPMAVRPALNQAGAVLLEIALSAESSRRAWTRADWRRVIKDTGGFSSGEAKRWLEILLACGILRDAALNRPDFRIEKLLKFLHQVAQ